MAIVFEKEKEQILSSVSFGLNKQRKVSIRLSGKFSTQELLYLLCIEVSFEVVMT